MKVDLPVPVSVSNTRAVNPVMVAFGGIWAVGKVYWLAASLRVEGTVALAVTLDEQACR